jgi:hypothetical protein
MTGGPHLSSPTSRVSTGLAPESDSPPPRESELRTPRTRGPHAKRLHRAIYSRRRPLESLTRAPSRLHQRRRNPSRRRFRFPPPALPRRQGARPETRKEVRDPPALLVFVPGHPVALGTSPEFPCRATASIRRSATLPPLSPPLLASPARASRVDAVRASKRASEPEFVIAGELRHRSPPATAARAAAQRLQASLAVGS